VEVNVLSFEALEESSTKEVIHTRMQKDETRKMEMEMEMEVTDPEY
jgi:hypothetical protein